MKLPDIKFRGKSISDTKWYYGDLISDDNGTMICYVIDIQPCMSEPGGYCEFFQEQVDINTIGQFTTKKDRNGKEIYEGDRISYTQHLFNVEPENYPKHYKTVCWDHNRAAWNIFETRTGESDIEAIGNIYDNPTAKQ